jgi:hypothetical protein
MIGEMSGGQHRDDEVTRTELVGWIGEKQTENCGAALGRKQRGCTTVGVCPKGIKKELNTLDGADFVRDVANRDYHHLSQNATNAQTSGEKKSIARGAELGRCSRDLNGRSLERKSSLSQVNPLPNNRSSLRLASD